MNAPKSIAVLLLSALLGTGVATAQGRFGQGRNQGGNRQQGQAGEWRRGGGGPHAGDWLRNHKDLPPAEQQRALQSDPAFRRLPPERQQRLLQRLQEFNSRPPEERDRILQRMEAWDRLNPAQRQRARDLFQQFRNLPEDRRRTLISGLRNLRNMSPQERQQALNSPAFRGAFTDQEREILRGMTDLDIGPGRGPSQSPGGNEVPRPPRPPD